MTDDPVFTEKTTSYLERLMAKSPAVRRMYRKQADEAPAPPLATDLMLEKALTPTFGLVHKYPGRALIMLSYTCAANCRYCERQDRVGVGLDRQGRMTTAAIDDAIAYVAADPSINEVIFSGGDPLTNLPGLARASAGFSRIKHVRSLRIHTRFPLQMPDKVDVDFLAGLLVVSQPFYLIIHVDHPDELTEEVRSLIVRLRHAGFILASQTVFLKGVNDGVEPLRRLFQELSWLGVRPYYIYHCQNIGGSDRFVMQLADEIEIMSRLREQLSGLAFPQHVIDIAHAVGKIVIPTEHWSFDVSRVRDFAGQMHLTEARDSSGERASAREQGLLSAELPA